MRITILQGAFLPVPPLQGGAVEKVWFALGKEFARRGHEVVHISRRHPDLPESETIAGVRHLRVGGYDTPASLSKLKWLDLLYTRRALRILPTADFLVTNTFWAPILLRHERFGRVCVHVARSPRWQFKLYGAAARFQTVSHDLAHRLKQRAPAIADRVRVLPNPLHSPVLSAPPPRSPAASPVFLFAGRLHPEKGVHLLIEAFTLLRNTSATLRLTGPWDTKAGGGGDDYLARLKALAEPLGGRVVFTGPLYQPGALEQAYREADVFVYPSLADQGETFGLAPLEAMAQGCPAIVSKLPCFGDFLEHDRNGLVFDHRVAEPARALANAMDRLTDDAGLRNRLTLAGLVTAADFSLEKVAQLYLSDFESLQKENSRP